MNGHTFDVAPGCSGLNLWVSLLFAFGIWQIFDRLSLRVYAGMVFMIPLITVALNAVRLAITALVAAHVSMREAVAIHTNLEFVLLPLGLIWMSKIGVLLNAKR